MSSAAPAAQVPLPGPVQLPSSTPPYSTPVATAMPPSAPTSLAPPYPAPAPAPVSAPAPAPAPIAAPLIFSPQNWLSSLFQVSPGAPPAATSRAPPRTPSARGVESLTEEGTDVLRRSNVSFVRAESELNECPICLAPIDQQAPGVRLSQCHGHAFHAACLAQCIKDDSLKCPLCAVVYGQPQTGTQPPGQMTVTRQSSSLRGHDGSGTIVITYSFPSGVQGPEHPSPGRPYRGDTRTAYLPDTPQGNAILEKLRTAWQRRLLFSIGVSLTLGPMAGERIVWSSIHQKTSMSGPHGFPDPGYFARVEDELAQFGI